MGWSTLPLKGTLYIVPQCSSRKCADTEIRVYTTAVTYSNADAVDYERTFTATQMQSSTCMNIPLLYMMDHIKVLTYLKYNYVASFDCIIAGVERCPFRHCQTTSNTNGTKADCKQRLTSHDTPISTCIIMAMESYYVILLLRFLFIPNFL